MRFVPLSSIRRVPGLRNVLLASMLLATIEVGDARGDTVALYADSLRTTCAGIPSQDRVLLWIHHYAPAGATGLRFRIPEPPCLVEIEGPISTMSPFTKIGRIDTGIEFQYGACLSGWVYVGVTWLFDYLGLGGWSSCCEVSMLAHPASLSGDIEIRSCDDEWIPAPHVSVIIYPNPTCPCDTPTGIIDPEPPMPSTWGAIKALYRE